MRKQLLHRVNISPPRSKINRNGTQGVGPWKGLSYDCKAMPFQNPL